MNELPARESFLNVRITTIVENTAVGPDVLGEHGLAFWIETSATRILFDAGRAVSFRHNVAALNIPLESADAVAISHGHYDHTEGLAYALPRMAKARVFMHPSARQPRFSLRGGHPHAIGIPADAAAALHDHASAVVWTSQPVEIGPGVFVTGAIPRQYPLEDTGGPFFLDAAGGEADPITDDQALWIEMAAGLVVVLGCAHSGVINTIEYIKSLTSCRPLLAVLGGMHLVAATPARLAWTVERVAGLDLKFLAPMHCTGMPALAALWNAMPRVCRPAGAGMVYDF